MNSLDAGGETATDKIKRVKFYLFIQQSFSKHNKLSATGKLVFDNCLLLLAVDGLITIQFFCIFLAKFRTIFSSLKFRPRLTPV